MYVHCQFRTCVGRVPEFIFALGPEMSSKALPPGSIVDASLSVESI